jgi:hypothetical protein
MAWELRYHGEFPPKQEPNNTQAADKEIWHDEENQHPFCLLQAWSERQEEGQINFLFLMYSPQVPPWIIAKKLVRFFGLDPVRNDRHVFIGVTAPSNEIPKPLYHRFNFKWEWQKAQFVQRGENWVWQSSGFGVVLPYQTSPITAQEEVFYEEQLRALTGEAKMALPAPKQTFYLPTFTTSVPAPRPALAEHATATKPNPVTQSQ